MIHLQTFVMTHFFIITCCSISLEYFTEKKNKMKSKGFLHMCALFLLRLLLSFNYKRVSPQKYVGCLLWETVSSFFMCKLCATSHIFLSLIFTFVCILFVVFKFFEKGFKKRNLKNFRAWNFLPKMNSWMKSKKIWDAI